MRVLKGFLTTMLILIITAVLPLLIYNKLYDTSYYSVDDGAATYMRNILQNDGISDEVKENTIKIMQEYSNILRYNKERLIKLFMYVSMLFGILLISIGIYFIKATKYKDLGVCILIAGVISVIVYIYIYSYSYAISML